MEKDEVELTSIDLLKFLGDILRVHWQSMLRPTSVGMACFRASARIWIHNRVRFKRLMGIARSSDDCIVHNIQHLSKSGGCKLVVHVI